MLGNWAIREKRVTGTSRADKAVVWFPWIERRVGGLGDRHLLQLGQ